MNGFIAWCQNTTVTYGLTAGQLIGIILAAFVAVLTVYAFAKDKAMIVTEYDSGDVVEWCMRTGGKLKPREEHIK